MIAQNCRPQVLKRTSTPAINTTHAAVIVHVLPIQTAECMSSLCQSIDGLKISTGSPFGAVVSMATTSGGKYRLSLRTM